MIVCNVCSYLRFTWKGKYERKLGIKLKTRWQYFGKEKGIILRKLALNEIYVNKTWMSDYLKLVWSLLCE